MHREHRIILVSTLLEPKRERTEHHDAERDNKTYYHEGHEDNEGIFYEIISIKYMRTIL